jgi:voltage-gated potassium channel Kch
VGGDEPRLMLGMRTRWVERAVGSNRILLYLAGITLGLSAVAGFLMHFIEEEAFPTVGTGVWWAVVTFCTVGYGDVVPTDALGRLVASIVMVFAITFITIATALVTSALVTTEQRRSQQAAEALHPPVHETLARIEARLDSLERRLTDS